MAAFDKQTFPSVRVEMEQAIRAVFAKHGFDVTVDLRGSGRFAPNEMQFQGRVLLAQSLGSKELTYNLFATKHNLVRFGDWFVTTIKGVQTEVTPIEVNKTFTKVVVKTAGGKLYSMTKNLILGCGTLDHKLSRVFTPEQLKTMEDERTSLSDRLDALAVAGEGLTESAPEMSLDF